MERRSSVFLAATLAAVLALSVAVAASCRGGSRPDADDRSSATPRGEGDASAVAPTSNEIVLLFPGSEDDLLHAEKRSVLPIEAPEERAKQCLEELLRGPSPGLLAVAPDGVRVREVYILPDGTAYADFSSELLNLRAGSQKELQTIYAIIDTLALNVRGVSRIGILVEGQARETIAGHVFARDPFVPDFRYVEESARPAAQAGAKEPKADGGDGKGGSESGGDAQATGGRESTGDDDSASTPPASAAQGKGP